MGNIEITHKVNTIIFIDNMYTIILTELAEYSAENKVYPKITKVVRTAAKNHTDVMRIIIEMSRTNDKVFNTLASTELAEEFLSERGVDAFPSPASDLFNEFCVHLETSPGMFISEVESLDCNPIFVIEDGYRNTCFENFIRQACNQFVHDELYRGIVPDDIVNMHYL